MGTRETKNVYINMVETPLIRRQCRKASKQMGDSIKMKLMNIGYEDGGWAEF
jgi:hypothetical protein